MLPKGRRFHSGAGAPLRVETPERSCCQIEWEKSAHKRQGIPAGAAVCGMAWLIVSSPPTMVGTPSTSWWTTPSRAAAHRAPQPPAAAARQRLRHRGLRAGVRAGGGRAVELFTWRLGAAVQHRHRQLLFAMGVGSCCRGLWSGGWPSHSCWWSCSSGWWRAMPAALFTVTTCCHRARPGLPHAAVCAGAAGGRAGGAGDPAGDAA